MPRKCWEPKNPYCRRSKLSKQAFENLVGYYIEEGTGGFRRTERVVLWARPRPESISRQTLVKYFNKISQFIWSNLIVPFDPTYKNKDMMEELFRCLLTPESKLTLVLNLDYHFIRPRRQVTASSIVTKLSDLIRFFLAKRSKRIKGVHKGKFYLEFSRSFFICSIWKEKTTTNNFISRGYDEYEKMVIVYNQSNALLLKLFREHPL